MRVLSKRALAAAAAGILVLSCGDLPTLADGIAYITRIERPSPALAINDQLRDSTGAVARLRVQAFDDKDQPIPNVVPTYVIASAPRGFAISSDGAVTASDTIGTAIFVARVSDRLQTIPETLFVVPPPDSLVPTAKVDTVSTTSPSSTLTVTVRGDWKGVRTPVRGIIVRFRIDSVLPSRTIDSASVAFTEPLRGTLRRAVDTTDVSGVASRTVVVVVAPGISSVYVTVTATTLKGQPLSGSPARFLVPAK